MAPRRAAAKPAPKVAAKAKPEAAKPKAKPAPSKPAFPYERGDRVVVTPKDGDPFEGTVTGISRDKKQVWIDRKRRFPLSVVRPA